MTRLLALGGVALDAASAMLHYPSATGEAGAGSLLLLIALAVLPVAYRVAASMLSTLEEAPEVLPALEPVERAWHVPQA